MHEKLVMKLRTENNIETVRLALISLKSPIKQTVIKIPAAERQVLYTTCSSACAESTSITTDMATYQGELTSQEVVKLIEAETDEGGDILEELTDQNIRGI